MPESTISLPRAAPRRRSAAIGFCALLLILRWPGDAVAQWTSTDPQAPEAPTAPVEGTPGAVRLIWSNDRPSLRLWNDVVRVDFRARLQGDITSARLEPEAPDRFDLGRRRIGINGSLGRFVDFQVERDLRTDKGWRDVFANVRLATAAQVKVGQFKLPFSMDELTSSSSLDFVTRSLAARALAPARDVGVMLHGRSSIPGQGSRLDYDLGLFRHDGDNAGLGPLTLLSPDAGQSVSQRTIAGRLRVAPFDRSKKAAPGKTGAGVGKGDKRGPGHAEKPGARKTRAPDGENTGPSDDDGDTAPQKNKSKKSHSALESLKLGLAFTTNQLPEGDNGLRGQDPLGKPFFPRVDVKGRRLRMGAEASWQVGPATVRAELLQVRDQRLGQGLSSEDLPPLVATGWYVQGTWTVVRGGRNATPRGRWIGRGGIGDLQLAARSERLGFASAGTGGEPESASPRAAHLAPVRDTVTTLGVNWRPVALTRIQLNLVRDRVEGFQWTKRDGQESVWSVVARFQVAF